jgi:hypothetical protein
MIRLRIRDIVNVFLGKEIGVIPLGLGAARYFIQFNGEIDILGCCMRLILYITCNSWRFIRWNYFIFIIKIIKVANWFVSGWLMWDTDRWV